MKMKWKVISFGLSTLIFLGGCTENMNANDENDQQNSGTTFASVQDYTGFEYELDNGEETDKIAEENQEEIDVAVKEFFKKEYNTDVTVNNTIGAENGATVIVQSVNQPIFNTYAVIPINSNEKTIDSTGVWTQEGQVEQAIRSGMYALIYEDELNVLNQYIDELVNDNPVVGIRDEVVETVRGNGFNTNYYYISTSFDAFEGIDELYNENPNRQKDEWAAIFKDEEISPELVDITIHLFMKESNKEPDSKLFEQIVTDIEKMEGLPPASYSIYLHDNRIGEASASGSKENSLERADPEKIIKP
ncbi:DUF1672 family protein [Jeotgalibacillus sp. S-D1]|uniref:DUF1672 family protein n=1 Tax=Jeotgalibacillus sp. S-D1 TaxID=2552189 RepID=UPI00105961A9|nr:DUF1672 family protein [Jeotgalibacillus sp. S-D1]TDL32022.1 DUF1672 family protein [Jeotgalibacillus sp. S-D1]